MPDEEQDQSSKLFSTEVEDDSETDTTIPTLRYDITSFGADFDVDGIVKRLQRGDIVIPEFQRSYVWNLPEASLFIESLLLGLPVPGIFLSSEEKSNIFLVIDGQQRLKSLQFFYEGYFNPRKDDKTRRVFALTNVQERFKGKTYKTLDDKDRRKLDSSIIHATIVRQESPPDGDTSMYHIFDRINKSGTRLTEHEIRCAVSHGTFIDQIKVLNLYQNWRNIYGDVSKRLKDQELILRFLALYYDLDKYERPMSDFLSAFASKHQHAEGPFLEECRLLFTSSIDIVWASLERKGFRLERAINAAVFDSVMVGLARRIQQRAPVDTKKFVIAYEALLRDKEYIQAVSRSTADENSVNSRMRKTTECFSNI